MSQSSNRPQSRTVVQICDPVYLKTNKTLFGQNLMMVQNHDTEELAMLKPLN